MGKMMEQFKLQQKSVRQKFKREQLAKQIPTFDNLKLDYNLENYYYFLNVKVTNLLNISEPTTKTTIISIQRIRNKPTITQIKCPICGSTIYLNTYWNCFICESNLHIKKIYEILEVKVPEYLQ